MRHLIAAAALALPLAAHAWGGDGHEAVATLAAALIKGSPAEARVNALLDGLTLPQAAVWADCAKGVSPDHEYSYPLPGRFRDCAPLETPARMAEMGDYVRRNDEQCQPERGEENCHKQYHYTDIAIQRSRYLPGFTGTSDHDIVAAATAAISVLQGRPATPPIDFKSPREALLVLVHLVGDLHQPLHVGGVYLDAKGQKVDPDKGRFDPASQTRGGLAVQIKARPKPAAAGAGEPVTFFLPPTLHSIWDDVPTSQDAAHVNAAWIAAARKIAGSRGDPRDWPARWASSTLEQAGLALQGLQFSARQGTHWQLTPPADYNARMALIKKQQLTLAGARLAQLLKALFPQ